MKEMRMKVAATAENRRIRREPARLCSWLKRAYGSFHGSIATSSGSLRPDIDTRVTLAKSRFLHDESPNAKESGGPIGIRQELGARETRYFPSRKHHDFLTVDARFIFVQPMERRGLD